MNKKTIVAVCFGISLTMPALAQQKNVVSAINYLGYYNKEKDAKDLIDAKKYIDLATENEETSGKAKTWFNRAEIYFNIHNSKDPKLAEFKEGAIDEAAKAYAKTIKLDDKKSFPTAERGLKNCAILSANSGTERYNAGDYAGAFSLFEKSAMLNEEYLQKIDTNMVYNVAIAASKGKMYNEAIKYLQKSIDIKYGGEAEGPSLYRFLASTYTAKGDKEGYKTTIQKGRKAYPNNKDLIVDEINIFIEAGQSKEALNNLQLASEKEPGNEIFPFNIGVIYDNMANPPEGKPAPTEAEYTDYVKKAEEAYKRALTINPEYFDALYNLGALYFNRAVKQSDFANNIKDNNKYKIESAKADEMFKQCLPYLEKGEEIRSNDIATYKNLIATLQKLYLMTEQAPKAIACKTRLAGGPNGIAIGDERAAVEEKLGKPVKSETKKGKFYNTDILDYPEYTVYMDGGQLTKWVKK